MQILIVANGPSDTEAAVTLGLQLVRRTGPPPTLLAVARRGAPGQPWSPDPHLAQSLQQLQSRAPGAQVKLRFGDPEEQILVEARGAGCELLIVGDACRQNAAARLLRGSLVLNLVEHAPCPVLVSKGRVGPIRRILVCDSGAEGPALPSQFTSRLVAQLGTEEKVTVLHVMSQISAGPGVPGRQLRASATELLHEQTLEGLILKRDLEILQQAGISPHPAVRHGLVVDEVLGEAQPEDHDLVVIGAHRPERWQQLLLGNLARDIVTRSELPVLVVK
jgi:nucleotide-binding universal stress UspA family protein